MDNKDLQDLGNAAKAGLGVLLKGALLGLAVTIAAPIAVGVAAASFGAGALATTGAVVLGLFGGGWLGRKLAGNYIKSNSGAAIVVAGKVVDELNKELAATGQPALKLEDLAKKFEETATKPAGAAPVAAAPAAVAVEQKPAAPSAP